MLNKIYIDNYKTFDNFEIDLSDVNLLLGKNGAGKSSLLEVLCCIRDFSVFGVLKDNGSGAFRFGGDTVTRWNDKKIQTFELHVDITGASYVYRLKFDNFGRPVRTRTLLEEVECDGSTVFRFEDGIVHLYNDKSLEDKVQYPFDWYQSALATIYARDDNRKVITFKNWLGRVAWTRINPWEMTASARREAILLDNDAGNFASWYRHVRQNCDISAVGAYIDDLKAVVPELKDLSIRGDGAEERELIIKPRGSDVAKAKSYDLTMSEMSEGQRVLMALYAILHFQVTDSSFVCIDEPDNFVSLSEIQPFLRELIQKVEETDSQVVITSHNPEVLNYMAVEYGKIMSRENGLQTRVKKFDGSDLEGLAPAECIARDWDCSR